MNKKLLILGSTALFLLTACTPPDDIIIDSEEEKIEEGADEISMWCMDFEEWENRITISQRKRFNSDVTDGIQLKQTFISSLNFDDLIRGAYESHNVPDIYMVSYGNLYKEINTGRAIDITNYFTAEDWADLTDTAKEGVCYGGKYYAAPLNMEPSTLLAYRKDLLEQYAPGSSVPTKWSDLLTLCGTLKTNIKAAKVKGLNTFGLPTGVALAWGSWGMQYAATGGLAVTDDWSESRVSHEGYTELCKVFRDIYTNGYVPLASGDYTQASFDLCDGKAVMTTCGSWSVASILNNNPELKDKIGFAVMPTLDGNQNVTTATNGGWVYVISSECKHPEKAAQVLKSLVMEDTSYAVDYFQQAKYSKAATRKSVQAILKETYKEQSEVPTDWIDVVNYVADRAILEPIYDWNISVAVEGMLEEAAMGESIKSAQEKADAEVKKYLGGTNPRLNA